MKYILISYENEKYRLELAEELFALRQIIVDELDGECKEVAQEAVEEIWTLAARNYYSEWLGELNGKIGIFIEFRNWEIGRKHKTNCTE